MQPNLTHNPPCKGSGPPVIRVWVPSIHALLCRPFFVSWNCVLREKKWRNWKRVFVKLLKMRKSRSVCMQKRKVNSSMFLKRWRKNSLHGKKMCNTTWCVLIALNLSYSTHSRIREKQGGLSSREEPQFIIDGISSIVTAQPHLDLMIVTMFQFGF